MKKIVINIYTTKGCPRCHMLVNMLNDAMKNNVEKCKNFDIKFYEITSDEDDTNYQLLIEHNIHTLPVMLVDDDFLNFAESVTYIRENLG